MKYISVLFIFVLIGCGNQTTALTGQAEDAVEKKRGEARLELFTKCMELSAKITRQADDDVSDIVLACSNQAYYMTNFIK